MAKSKMTKQGVRDLNHNFGPPVKRKPDYPDNCTLGLHPWDEWQFNGYYASRQCLDCEEIEYKDESPKMKNNAFGDLEKMAA